MKVYLGNNLGYWLQLIGANQKKRHSRLVGDQFQRAKMSPLVYHYPFFMRFRDKFKTQTHSDISASSNLTSRLLKETHTHKNNPVFLA